MVSTSGKLVVWGPVVWISGIPLLKGIVTWWGTPIKKSQTTNPNHPFYNELVVEPPIWKICASQIGSLPQKSLKPPSMNPDVLSWMNTALMNMSSTGLSLVFCHRFPRVPKLQFVKITSTLSISFSNFKMTCWYIYIYIYYLQFLDELSKHVQNEFPKVVNLERAKSKQKQPLPLVASNQTSLRLDLS